MLRRRMSLGKATGEKFAPAKSTIAGVHNQLEKGFLPGENANFRNAKQML